MPRGEETQEGREETKEVQEQEAQRDQEVVEAPQAVVERERPVAESEAIEAAVVEAIEAVPENGGRGTGEDGGPETGDRGQAQSGEEISATPINTPYEDPEKLEDPKGEEISRPNPVGDGTRYELDKSPNDVKEDEGLETGDQGGQAGGSDEISATPINTPGLADEISLIPENDGVSEMPDEQQVTDSSPAPEWDEDPPRPPQETMTDGGRGTEDGVAQTAEDMRELDGKGAPQAEVQPEPGSGEAGVGATPINLPRVADKPDQEDMEISEPAGEEGAVLETEIFEREKDVNLSEVEVGIAGEGDQTQDELVPEIESAAETLGEEGETDEDTADPEGEESLDSFVEISPEELVGEGEMAEDLKDVKEIGPDWYIHEDSDGNITLVDSDGNPVKSPPILYQYKGKTYAAYPGDKPAIDEKGSIVDPSKLIGFPDYQTSVADMFLHDDGDGNITVVDKDGNPVPSQPSITTFKGKVYIGYPGQDLGLDETGHVTDQKTLTSHEASYFKQSTNEMFLHDDGDGNLTVVDKNGKPVASQPSIITYEGKNYIVYPGQELGLDETGQVTDAKVLKENEASYFQQSTAKMYLHDDGNGNYTVVNAEGKPVDSPPNIFVKDGKNYATYPGWDVGVDSSGKDTDPRKLNSLEIGEYQGGIRGMFIHDDGEGNLTVVDTNGKPVDSPPIIVENDDGMYIAYPSLDAGIDSKGIVTDPAKYKSHQVSYFAQDTKDMYIHDDGKGNYTVVDGDGDPVDSPPMIVEKDGKIYATYHDWDDGINEKGYVTNPTLLKEREISFYSPPWWQKQQDYYKPSQKHS